MMIYYDNEQKKIPFFNGHISFKKSLLCLCLGVPCKTFLNSIIFKNNNWEIIIEIHLDGKHFLKIEPTEENFRYYQIKMIKT